MKNLEKNRQDIFSNLENRNFMDKVITKLVDTNGEEYRWLRNNTS